MKSFFFCLLPLCVVLACACSTNTGPTVKGPAAPIPPVALELKRATAALVDEEDHSHTYCAAVWVSDTELLTAGHCVEAEVGDRVGNDWRSKLFVLYKANPDDSPHVALFWKGDHFHDLALLMAPDPPLHGSVHVAPFAALAGDELHVVGHPRGMVWSYYHGYVIDGSRFYSTATFDIEGPFLQAQVPVAPGNSGGGAFDSNGDLVGICSFLRRDLPGQGFFIPSRTILAFLTSGA